MTEKLTYTVHSPDEDDAASLQQELDRLAKRNRKVISVVHSPSEGFLIITEDIIDDELIIQTDTDGYFEEETGIREPED